MIKLLATLLAAVALAVAAAAQTVPIPGQPFVLPVSVGTIVVSAAPQNTLRKKIVFINPNATAKIAVCPTVSRTTSTALPCTVGGAGSIVILPYSSFAIDTPGITLASPWNAIADAGGSALTVLEFE